MQGKRAYGFLQDFSSCSLTNLIAASDYCLQETRDAISATQNVSSSPDSRKSKFIIKPRSPAWQKDEALTHHWDDAKMRGSIASSCPGRQWHREKHWEEAEQLSSDSYGLLLTVDSPPLSPFLPNLKRAFSFWSLSSRPRKKAVFWGPGSTILCCNCLSCIC